MSTIIAKVTAAFRDFAAASTMSQLQSNKREVHNKVSNLPRMRQPGLALRIQNDPSNVYTFPQTTLTHYTHSIAPNGRSLHLACVGFRLCTLSDTSR